jgi:hypothetical protein
MSSDTGYSPLPTMDQLSEMERELEQHQQASEKKQAEPIVLPEDDETVPEKFRNKPVTEVLRSYQELEKDRGRLASEVGQLRRMTEELIALKKEQDLPDEEVKVTPDDLYDNPAEAIRKVTAKESEKLRQELAQTRAELLELEFEREFPGYREDMADPEFIAFVNSDPERQQLAAQAAQNTDLRAARQIWSTYRQQRKDAEAQGAKNDDAQQKRNEQLKQASLVPSGGETSADAGKPIYSAEEIQHIMINDPDRYWSPRFQSLIQEAFAEDRVR